eukprot:6182510-Pleurochrysis_carterae.AAC.1
MQRRQQQPGSVSVLEGPTKAEAVQHEREEEEDGALHLAHAGGGGGNDGGERVEQANASCTDERCRQVASSLHRSAR